MDARVPWVTPGLVELASTGDAKGGRTDDIREAGEAKRLVSGL